MGRTGRFQQVANIADEMINSTTIEHKMNLKAGEEYLKKHGKTAGQLLSELRKQGCKKHDSEYARSLPK